MYCVKIYNKKKFSNVGPVFFTGDQEKYNNLKDALRDAESWVKSQADSQDLVVEFNVVSCL